jgi:beta-lactamase regulating signal transducer with metallopeptidase domain
MFDYLLNSGICLLVFYTFYKLFLEQENMHVYKRIYLLGIVIISFIIPKITYTTYIEVKPQLVSEIIINTLPMNPVNEVVEPQNILPILLLVIYLIGLVVFGFRFLKNFTIIYLKINRNQKIKNENSTSVLLIEDIVPHTFLNFIFFNKQKYLTKNIPTEVIIHEETHSKQKHTLDVLFIEILKVVFWFNPIFYFIEKSIKLNHEFLADQAVVNAGFQDTKYQNTLLAYSSHANQFQLANAINYSSIKKRLVIMKKQKSKRKIAVRGILLIPIFAILLLSFSTAIQEPKATPKQIKEYNTLAKQYNAQPQSQKIVKLKEVNRLNYLYKLMSPEQKANAEQFPEFPPMPPKSGELGLSRVTKHFYEYKDISGKDVKVELQYDGHKDFYNTPPPPPIPKNATEKEKLEYARVIQKYREDIAKQKQLLDKLVTDYKSNDSIYIDKNEWINNAKEIYFNEKLITKIKAKSIIKNNEVNLLFGDSVLKIFSEPIGSLPKKVIKGVNDTDSNNPPPPPK